MSQTLPTIGTFGALPWPGTEFRKSVGLSSQETMNECQQQDDRPFADGGRRTVRQAVAG